MKADIIPLLSLIVAGLAVFFGPLVSLYIAKRTLKVNSQLAKQQLISPIRQQWIDKLRDTIAELTSKSAHYWVSGVEDRLDEEYYRITELEHKIRLLINPNEDDHRELVRLIKNMTNDLYAWSSEHEPSFWKAHQEIISLSQKILKREWERVKTEKYERKI